MSLTALEDKPPTKNKIVAVVATSVVVGIGVGGACTTTWPIEPPIPKLEIEMIDLPEDERQLSGMGCTGTVTSRVSQLIVVAGREKLTEGGIMPCSKIKQALTSAARKAATSRCLDVNQRRLPSIACATHTQCCLS
jgi:hypothetical protein